MKPPPKRKWELHSIPVLTALVLALALGMLYFLLPDRRQVLERAFRDQDLTRIQKILEEAKAQGEGEGDALYGLLTGWLELRKTLADLRGARLPLPVAEKLSSVFFTLIDEEEVARFAKQGLAETLAHTDSYDFLHAQVQRIKSDPHFSEPAPFFSQMEKFALAAGNPLAAAFAAQENSEDSFADIFKIAELWQQANQQERGIAFIEQWFETHPAGQLPPGSGVVIEKYLEKLRAYNRNDAITDFLVSRWEELSESVNEEWLPIALARAALASGKSKEAISPLEEWLTTHPDSPQLWSYLADVAMGAGDVKLAAHALGEYIRLEPNDKAKKMAEGKALEWSGAPGQAFDTYLPLAKEGNREALDRMVALAPGLHRETDLTQVLPRFLPEEGTNADVVRLAHLFVLAGDYAAARKLYHRHLQYEANDAKALWALGEIDMVDELFDEARDSFNQVLQLEPGNLEAKHQLIKLDWLNGKFDGILDRLRFLAHEVKDERSIQEYYSAAESLGNMEALIDAAKLRIAKSDTPVADLYRNLFYFQTLIGRDADALQTARDAVQIFPQSPMFRDQLVFSLILNNHRKDALDYLRSWIGPASSSDMKSTYIGLLMEFGEQNLALDFMQHSLTPEEAQQRDVREMSAYLLESANRFAESEALFRGLMEEFPDKMPYRLGLARTLGLQNKNRDMRSVLLGVDLAQHPDLMRQVAQVYLDINDYRQGTKLLKQYVTGVGAQDPLAWRLLGDASLSLGDKHLSKQAYQRALVLAKNTPPQASAN